VISGLLESAARRTEAADLSLKTDETLTLRIEAGRLRAAGRMVERGVNLRVVANGRMGFAGTTAEDPEALLESALASARVGEAVNFSLPEPAAMPAVATHFPRAAAATIDDLTALGRSVHDRLARDGCQVNVTLERSIGTVRVANTAGVDASYDVSAVSLSAELIRVRSDDILTLNDFLAGADLPSPQELDRLVATMLQRLEWARHRADPPRGRLPVYFSPAGTRVLMVPLHAAFQGKSVLHGVSPFASGRVVPRFADSISIHDQPLVPGRAGSRPVDDEGVPSRPTALLERGDVRGFIYDLESAARAGVPPSGHGRRTVFGKPQAAFSNIVMGTGELSDEELLGLIPSGLLVDELLGVGQGNVIGGNFAHSVGVAYRVENGEVVGRVAEATVAGNAYGLLGRVSGIGREAPWRGSTAIPGLVVEGVTVD
jgi:PmbA protein